MSAIVLFFAVKMTYWRNLLAYSMKLPSGRFIFVNQVRAIYFHSYNWLLGVFEALFLLMMEMIEAINNLLMKSFSRFFFCSFLGELIHTSLIRKRIFFSLRFIWNWEHSNISAFKWLNAHLEQLVPLYLSNHDMFDMPTTFWLKAASRWFQSRLSSWILILYCYCLLFIPHLTRVFVRRIIGMCHDGSYEKCKYSSFSSFLFFLLLRRCT